MRALLRISAVFIIGSLMVGCGGSSYHAQVFATVDPSQPAQYQAESTKTAEATCLPIPPTGFANSWQVSILQWDLRPTLGDLGGGRVAEDYVAAPAGDIFLALTLSVTNLQSQPALFPDCRLLVSDLHGFTFPSDIGLGVNYLMNHTNYLFQPTPTGAGPVPPGIFSPRVVVFEVKDSSAGFILKSTDGSIMLNVGR